MRTRSLKGVWRYGLVLFVLLTGTVPVRILAQPGAALLDRTSFGHSQNDAVDLQNSLIPGEKKFGKGEKKLEVNAAELQTKKEKDTTFGGSLLNMGIDPTEPKLDSSKQNVAPREQQPAKSVSTKPTEPAVNASTQSEVAEKEPTFSDLSSTAVLGEELADPSEPTEKERATSTTSNPANAKANNDQRDATTSNATQDKVPAEKPSKPDGDH